MAEKVKHIDKSSTEISDVQRKDLGVITHNTSKNEKIEPTPAKRTNDLETL
jgi:hypothetical protein